MLRGESSSMKSAWRCAVITQRSVGRICTSWTCSPTSGCRQASHSGPLLGGRETTVQITECAGTVSHDTLHTDLTFFHESVALIPAVSQRWRVAFFAYFALGFHSRASFWASAIWSGSICLASASRSLAPASAPCAAPRLYHIYALTKSCGTPSPR